jgi:GT2 family glycosyltransferase
MKSRGNFELLGAGMPCPHPGMVVRRAVFEELGGFSMSYKIAMDFDFVVRMIRAGVKGVYLPGPVIRMDGGGVSSSRELQGIFECRSSLVENGLFHFRNRLAHGKRMVRFLIRDLLLKTIGKRAFLAIRNLIPGR